VIRLHILSGKAAGQVILVRRFPFRIGRSPQADLSLTEPGVWDQHCQIDHQPGEGCLVTTVPQAETRIDAQPVEGSKLLPNGAELSLGAVRLRFSLADPPPRSLRLREAAVWLFLAAVVAGEVWLIRWLP
jgi:hypothetical protein